MLCLELSAEPYASFSHSLRYTHLGRWRPGHCRPLWVAEYLEHKLPDLFNDDGVFDRHQDAKAN
jgi:hypothetical protein